jgi:hypothetical protein
METSQIHAACTQAGIVPEALDVVTARVRAHFGDSPVRPADLTNYLASLDVWVKLGMTYEAFATMPPTWRIAQGWAHQPPPVSRKPDSRSLTAEELRTIEGLAWAERMTRGREMQQTPPQSQG